MKDYKVISEKEYPSVTPAALVVVRDNRPMTFALGVFVTLAVLAIAGVVSAASVFNANGGQITNLGEPSASTDAATKSYVDTALAATWVSVDTSACNSYRCYYATADEEVGGSIILPIARKRLEQRYPRSVRIRGISME